MAHSKKPNRTTHRSPSEYKAAMAAWNKAHQPKNGDGTTAKERLDAFQKARDEARNPTVKSTTKSNKEILKKKTSSSSEIESDSNYIKENRDFNDATSGARTKRLAKEKAVKDKAAKEAAVKKEAKAKSKWLKKSRNSPAARAFGNSKEANDKRWALQKKHREWKADRKSGKLKKDRKKNLKITTWRDLE